MVILMYHGVVAGAPEDIHDVSLHCFAEQMALLADSGFEVVPLAGARALKGRPGTTRRKTVALTFDDGYENNYTYALPILESFCFPAAVFAVVGAINAAATWRAGNCSADRLLRREQIQEMASRGILFGSHTMTHPRLAQLANQRRIDHELTESKLVLEQILEASVNSLSYPFSSVNQQVERSASLAGYDAAYTYDPGYVGSPGDSALRLRRVGILASDDRSSFQRKINASAQLRIRWLLRRLRQDVLSVIVRRP